MRSIGNPSSQAEVQIHEAAALIFPAIEQFIPPVLDRELARLRSGAWHYDVLNAQRILRLELLQACRPEQPFQETLREVWHTWLCAGCVAAPMPHSSSLAEARARLPVWAMEMLFKHSATLALQAQPPSPWPGHRLLSMDATMLPVTNTPALRAHFGTTSTQHGEAYYPQALAVWLALVTNGAVVAEHLGPSRQGEESIAPYLLPAHLRAGDLVLGDARIGSSPTIVQTARSRAFFLFRAPGPLDVEQRVVLRWNPDDADICLRLSERTRQRHSALSLPPHFETRAVWFEIPARDCLNRCERAAFLTNLPREHCPVHTLARLALLRWSHETLNNDIKTRLGLGEIRSQNLAGIRREVLAHLCVANFLRVLLTQAQPDIPMSGSFTAARSALYQANQQLRSAAHSPAAVLALLLAMIRQQSWTHRPPRAEPRMIRPARRRHRVFKTSRVQWRTERKGGANTAA